MSDAFDGHCLQHNIVDETEKSNNAKLVMLLFDCGARTVDEIRAGLDRLRKL